MAYSLSNSYNAAGAGASTTIAVASVVVPAGAMIEVTTTYGAASNQTVSVADGTNTYTQIASSNLNDGTNEQNFAAHYCLAPTAGTYTVTATIGASESFRGICVKVWSGLDQTTVPLIKTANPSAPGSGANAVTSGNLNFVTQPALSSFVCMDDSGTETSFTAGTGYTGRGGISAWESTFGVKTLMEDKRVTATGNNAATATAGDGTGRILIYQYDFIEAAGGATTRGTPFGHKGTAFNGGRTFHGIIQ